MAAPLAAPAGEAASGWTDWSGMHQQARATAAWLEMLDLGRRKAIRHTRAELRTPSQWTLRDLVLDLQADLLQALVQAPVKPRVITLHADVVTIPADVRLHLDGMALVIAARRIEVRAPTLVRLDYRSSRSARLLVFAQEIVGAELTGLGVLPGNDVRSQRIWLPPQFPPQLPPAAGVWLRHGEHQPLFEPLARLPEEWFSAPSQAWSLAASSFQMAVALLDTQRDVAMGMLQHIVNSESSVPAEGAQRAEWLELVRASRSLLQDGAAGVRAWAIDYGRQLFRGTPAEERRRRADELQRSWAASALSNQHALVRSAEPAPDPTHLRYVRHGALALGLGRLNGILQPRRSVSLSGVELVLDAADSSRFLQCYSGQTDLQSLEIHADTLVIKAGLRLPQTDVTIRCRTLYFEGPDAWIDVSPSDKLLEPAPPAAGDTVSDAADGLASGNIRLHIARFGTSEGPAARHFRLCGGSGQAADDGGFYTSVSTRHLRPIEETDWEEVFSYDHRRMQTGTVDKPLWSKHQADDIVYLELRIGGSKVASAGQRAEPGAGGAGRTAGRPGRGGRGGKLSSMLDEVFAHADLRGGVSGRAHGASKGGAGGTPTHACWLIFDNPDGSQMLTPTREAKDAAWGPDSEPGPEALAPEGEAGACVLLPCTAGERPWLTPLNLGVAVQFARDALAAGEAAPAREMLVPYLPPSTAGGSALAEASAIGVDTLALAPWTRQAAELAELALRNVDSFGHPPGWVPRLSLSSTVKAYRIVLDGAMQELYTAYCLQRSWQDKADRQKGMQDLVKQLGRQTGESRAALASLRTSIASLVGELKQLQSETTDTGKRLDELQRKLAAEADDDTAAEERKRIVTESFRILGAVVKAIPLPEPYQAAAAVMGGLFDTAGNLIDDGNTAFAKLNAQVEKFGVDHTDALATTANQDLATAVQVADTDITALQLEAAKTQEKLTAMAADQAKASEAYKEGVRVRSEIHKARREALLYGRAPSTDKKALAIKAGLLEKAFQNQEAELLAKQTADTRKYLDAEKLLASRQGAVAARQEELATLQTTLAEKQAASAQSIKDGLKKVENLVAGLDSINQSIGRLAVPRAQLNSQWDKALADLKSSNPEFKTVSAQLAYLQQARTQLGNRLLQMQTELARHKSTIATNLVAVHGLTLQIARAHDTLAPEVAVYAQALGQEAHRELQRFLYYVVKAYEHQRVQAWTTPYQGAQALFDQLRNVLQTSDGRDSFVNEEDADQRARLTKLLAGPTAGQAGKLTPDEFKLLRVVYEKPLRDMGRQLLMQMMEGSITQEAPFGITLRAAQLRELNQGIARRTETALPFDLVRLRQVDPRKEYQRIANIRVTRLRCRQVGAQLPDRVALRFTLNGKSLVRAQGRLYAFESEGERTAAGGSGSALCFETQGGTSDKAGWQGEGEAAVLQSHALWQPTPTSDEGNLLSQLLSDDKEPNADRLMMLSGFRPGAYSEFTLSVSLSPAGSALEIEEMDVQVSMEGRNAPADEWVVCASVDVPNLVPLRTDRPDRAGHLGGLGRYVGVFQGPVPVALRAPCRVGGLLHSGWLVDGQPASGQIEDGWSTITLSQSRFAVACYEPT